MRRGSRLVASRKFDPLIVDVTVAQFVVNGEGHHEFELGLLVRDAASQEVIVPLGHPVVAVSSLYEVQTVGT